MNDKFVEVDSNSGIIAIVDIQLWLSSLVHEKANVFIFMIIWNIQFRQNVFIFQDLFPSSMRLQTIKFSHKPSHHNLSPLTSLLLIFGLQILKGCGVMVLNRDVID